jgi:hypothetical protein
MPPQVVLLRLRDVLLDDVGDLVAGLHGLGVGQRVVAERGAVSALAGGVAFEVDGVVRRVVGDFRVQDVWVFGEVVAVGLVLAGGSRWLVLGLSAQVGPRCVLHPHPADSA